MLNRDGKRLTISKTLKDALKEFNYHPGIAQRLFIRYKRVPPTALTTIFSTIMRLLKYWDWHNLQFMGS